MPEALVGAFSLAERRILIQALDRGVNAPWTSSAGRLFDAFAALAGLRLVTRYEGQTATELEFAAEGVEDQETYPFAIEAIDGQSPAVIDWRPMLEAFLSERRAGVALPFLSARFHNTLVEMIVAMARRVGQRDVALSGGCFQNRRLSEGAIRRLRAAGFRPLHHRLVPPNDGGIALGQVAVASARLARKES
jgi:hydrogenase maturation protein HypF